MPKFNESDRCPNCGAINLLDFEGMPDTFVRGQTWDIDGETFAHGSACWDSPWGDECGACLRTIVNPDNYPSVFGL
jgi:hypothetical protein